MPDPKKPDDDEPREYDYEVVDDDAEEIDFSDEAYDGDDRGRPPPPGRRRRGDRPPPPLPREGRARDDDDDRDRPPARRRECPHCGDDGPPRVDRRVSAGGWVLFAVLLLGCTPLCFLPFVIDACKEDVRRCGHCGGQLP